MTTPEIPMDALRKFAFGAPMTADLIALQEYVRAVDAERDAWRDGALAVLIINVLFDERYVTPEEAKRHYDVSLPRILKAIPAIRAHIEAEAKR